MAVSFTCSHEKVHDEVTGRLSHMTVRGDSPSKNKHNSLEGAFTAVMLRWIPSMKHERWHVGELLVVALVAENIEQCRVEEVDVAESCFLLRSIPLSAGILLEGARGKCKETSPAM